jgi:hypothetical protein
MQEINFFLFVVENLDSYLSTQRDLFAEVNKT